MARVKKATIRDVARRAGVAVGTISHYLNRRVPVSNDKRLRIEQAIHALGYRANPMARSLVTGRASIVSFAAMIGSRAYASYFFSEILSGIAEAALAANWTIHYIPVDRNGSAPGTWDAHLLDLSAGILILDQAAATAPWPEIQRQRYPVVLLNTRQPRTASVEVDNAHGGRLAAEFLFSLGHRRIAVLGTDRGIGLQRTRGAVRYLREHHIRPQILFTEFTARTAVAGTRALLAQPAHARPTALFCTTDLMARASIEEAQRCGLSVPGDLSVVGFDDSALAEECSPALTTVRQPAREMGRRALESLLQLMQGQAPSACLLPAMLVLRETVAAPATA